MELSPGHGSILRDLTLDGGDFLAYDLGELRPGDRGRIVEFSLRLKDVAPDRRVALAVALSERDDQDREAPRGIRTYVVPPHQDGEQDVVVRPIRFILPEALTLSEDGPRRLTVRADAHYVERNGSSVL